MIDKFFNGLITEGGAWGILCVALIIAIVYLAKQRDAAQRELIDEVRKSSAALAETKVAVRDITEALGSHTDAMKDLARAQADLSRNILDMRVRT